VEKDLCHKAFYVARGYLTDPPSLMTYSIAMSRESIRIAYLIAALSNLEVLAGDIQNAYLNAQNEEKLFFYTGKEWKADTCRPELIIRTLYGLKSRTLAWINIVSDVLANILQYTLSLADPEVWYKPSEDSMDKEYYLYILIYVDDILVINKNPTTYIEMLLNS
jgi:hypothetical protein